MLSGADRCTLVETFKANSASERRIRSAAREPCTAASNRNPREHLPSRPWCVSRGVVYIDAVIPKDGDTGESVKGPEVIGSFRRLADGLTVPAPPASLFGLSGDSEAWVDERTTPHPYRTLTQPIALSGEWLRVPRKVFIRAGAFKAPYLDGYLERAKLDPEWRTVECDEIHDMMIANPDYVSGLLMTDEVCGDL
jgi:hypothetical protein